MYWSSEFSARWHPALALFSQQLILQPGTKHLRVLFEGSHAGVVVDQRPSTREVENWCSGPASFGRSLPDRWSFPLNHLSYCPASEHLRVFSCAGPASLAATTSHVGPFASTTYVTARHRSSTSFLRRFACQASRHRQGKPPPSGTTNLRTAHVDTYTPPPALSARTKLDGLLQLAAILSAAAILRDGSLL